jgi:hypothetical protein
VVGQVVGSLAAIRHGDDVAGPGTGAVALGALQLVRDAPGSLVVPRVVIGRRDSEPWITTITRAGDRPAAARLPRIPPGGRPSRALDDGLVFTLDAGCQHLRILRTCRARSPR